MKKAKAISLLLSGIVVTGFGVNMGSGFKVQQAKAETRMVNEYTEDLSNASTRGIYTALSLSINGGNGRIWATVKNDLTLFPSTVFVIVELYSSETYCESYLDMELVSRNSTIDLNMGDTIVAEAMTGGVQKYWHARMRYKRDNDAWKEGSTGTLLYSADGTFLNIT